MKTLFIIPLCAAVSFLSACAQMKTVRVRVLDEKNQKPVEGARVATGYSPARYSLASCEQSIATTDKDGLVILETNRLRIQPTLYGYTKTELAPFYCVESNDYLYIEHWPSFDEVSTNLTIKVTPRGNEPRNEDDLWIQPGFFSRIRSDLSYS